VGDPLNQQVLAAFADELELMEKEASIGGAALTAGKWLAGRPGWAYRGIMGAKGKGFREAGKRLLSPIKSTKAQWKGMEPGAVGALKKSRWDNKVQRAAKHLGQKGWTGKGKFTKYLPVGQKGLTVGLTGGFAAPAIADAAKKTVSPTGEGGLGEVGLGEALGLGGMVMGTGLGLAPAIGLYSAGSYLGGKAGRIIDRLRGGADVGTAVNAPSRREAEEQLANIQRYHG